jgi:4-hydroxybenzoate polyprenyltransferase
MLKPLLIALRPKQWIKNLIIFGPLVFSLNLNQIDMGILAVRAFLTFCAVSGAVYLLNDIFDRERDKQHPIKKARPIASGALSVPAALVAIAVILVVAVLSALSIGTGMLLIISAYIVNNILYSFRLKHVVIVDVGSIATGFVLRVLAGAVAIDVIASPWLIMCTILLASFLGFSKRRHELLLLQDAGDSHREVLQEYSEQLLDQLIMISAATTLMSYALYTVSEKVIESFGTTNLIYTVPFVLYGLFRYLYLVHMKNSGGSPTEVLLTDLPLVTSVAAWLVVCTIIVYGT